MEEEARVYFRKLDEMGGMLRAIERGFPQQEILEASQRYQHEVDNKARIIVGVNEYIEENDRPLPILKIGPEVEQSQVERLKSLRDRREAHKVSEALQTIRRFAWSDKNLMPYLIAALKEHATLGEICSALKEVFGTYQEPVVL